MVEKSKTDFWETSNKIIYLAAVIVVIFAVLVSLEGSEDRPLPAAPREALEVGFQIGKEIIGEGLESKEEVQPRENSAPSRPRLTAEAFETSFTLASPERLTEEQVRNVIANLRNMDVACSIENIEAGYNENKLVTYFYFQYSRESSDKDKHVFFRYLTSFAFIEDVNSGRIFEAPAKKVKCSKFGEENIKLRNIEPEKPKKKGFWSLLFGWL